MIAIAGARDCYSLRVVVHAFNFLKVRPASTTVLLRHPLGKRPAGPLERTVAEMANELGFNVQWCRPAPGGREQVYRRDFEMVEQADGLLAYFALRGVMTGGTGHVVDAAISRNIPTRAFAYDPELGMLTLVGSWDREGILAYGGPIPEHLVNYYREHDRSEE